MLAIPKSKGEKFELFASLTLDFIWMAKNKLIHDGIQPSHEKAIMQIEKAIKHIPYTLGLHCGA